MKRLILMALSATLLMWFISCKNKDLGGIKIDADPSLSEITIDEFPMPQIGIEGPNVITWPPEFSFKAIDEVIYDNLVSKSYTNNVVSVKLRFLKKDAYGKMVLDEWESIGSLNSEEAKKYVDFATWNGNYGLFKLLNASDGEKEVSASITEPVSKSQTDAGIHVPKTEEEKSERLHIFDPVPGVNTTEYNQSNENLEKLNWRIVEDVFFNDIIDFLPEFVDVIGEEGTIIDYKGSVYTGYDVITIKDTSEGTIDVHLHSIHSGKSIIRPKNKWIGKGDRIKFWGTYIDLKGKKVWYLKQAILKEDI